MGNLTIELSPSSQKLLLPSNDSFQTPIALAGLNVASTTVSDYASAESGEPAHAGQAAAKSLWWTWTAPSSGQTTIHTIGSNFDTILAVYTGTKLGELTTIASNNDSGDSTSSVTFNAITGTAYRIAVSGRGGASGSVNLTVVGNPTPVNNNFSAALTLTLEDLRATTSVTNQSATKEPSEPNHAGFTGGSSVWWKFTPSVSGLYSVDTFGSEIDTLLGVYTGSRVDRLTTLASNDDTNGSQSFISARLTAGVTYSTAVDGYSAAQGVIILNLNRILPPENDAFATPFTLTASSGSISAANQAATSEAGEPSHAGRSASRSLWWIWTAPEDGFAALSTARSTFNTTLAVYRGSSLSTLNLVTSNDDSNSTLQSQVSFAVTAGTTYRIAVDSFDAIGTGTIALALNPTLPAPTFSLIKYQDAAEKSLIPGSFAITMSAAQPAPVTVMVEMRGSALPDVDYTSSTPIINRAMQVTFAPLQVLFRVTLTPLADSNFLEFDELITPTLPSGLAANLLIRDDTPYTAAWVASIGSAFTNALSNPNDDVDSDGSSNLLEYALGENPISGPPATHNPILSSGLFLDTDERVLTYATLTFLRRTGTNLKYEVQSSDSLQTWSSMGVVPLEDRTVNVSPGLQRVTFRASTPLTHGPSFMRLVVTWP